MFGPADSARADYRCTLCGKGCRGTQLCAAGEEFFQDVVGGGKKAAEPFSWASPLDDDELMDYLNGY